MQKLLGRDYRQQYRKFYGREATETSGAETPEKRLAIYSIDDSVENSIGGRLYPRTEAPGV